MIINPIHHFSQNRKSIHHFTISYRKWMMNWTDCSYSAAVISPTPVQQPFNLWTWGRKCNPPYVIYFDWQLSQVALCTWSCQHCNWILCCCPCESWASLGCNPKNNSNVWMRSSWATINEHLRPKLISFRAAAARSQGSLIMIALLSWLTGSRCSCICCSCCCCSCCFQCQVHEIRSPHIFGVLRYIFVIDIAQLKGRQRWRRRRCSCWRWRWWWWWWAWYAAWLLSRIKYAGSARRSQLH